MPEEIPFRQKPKVREKNNPAYRSFNGLFWAYARQEAMPAISGSDR